MSVKALSSDCQEKMAYLDTVLEAVKLRGQNISNDQKNGSLARAAVLYV